MTENTTIAAIEERPRSERPRQFRAAVVVLDDIGLSPRMQYHALSLARQEFFKVDVVCYEGTDPHNAILETPSIHLHKMGSVPCQDSPSFPCQVKLILKVVYQFFVLLWFILFKIPSPGVFIVQNPPVPALLLFQWVSWFRQSTLIVDWHNIRYNNFGFSHRRFPTSVKIYHWFEKHLGRMTDGAFCATKAIQHELAQNYGIKAEVLYDRSHEIFYPATLKEKHELFFRLKKDLGYPHHIHNCVSYGKASFANSGEVPYASDTFLTCQVDGNLFEMPDRPAIVVTSMSWTRDKNFSTLLEAAVIYDRCAASLITMDSLAEQKFLYGDINSLKKNMYPKLLFIIIVRGPKRKKYEEVLQKTHMKYVAFRLLWLPTEDYQILLGSADLGVCLHTSSSGMNLPVTVADMFGCGLPVCATSFSCVEELMDVWKDGLIFSSPSNLADTLMTLFRGFPDHCDALKLMRVGALAKASSRKWSDEWKQHAMPIIHKVMSRESKATMLCKKLRASLRILIPYVLLIYYIYFILGLVISFFFSFS